MQHVKVDPFTRRLVNTRLPSSIDLVMQAVACPKQPQCHHSRTGEQALDLVNQTGHLRPPPGVCWLSRHVAIYLTRQEKKLTHTHSRCSARGRGVLRLEIGLGAGLDSVLGA